MHFHWISAWVMHLLWLDLTSGMEESGDQIQLSQFLAHSSTDKMDAVFKLLHAIFWLKFEMQGIFFLFKKIISPILFITCSFLWISEKLNTNSQIILLFFGFSIKIKLLFLYESIYAMAIEKFLYLLSLGWLVQEYNFRMGRGFQVWKFHLKVSPWEEKLASKGL